MTETSATGGLVLSAHDVHKWFGRSHVLRGASLRIQRGRIVALIGENGSGKSTLLQIMADVLPYGPGFVVRNASLGYCPQSPALYPYLTPHEHFRLFGAAHRFSPEEIRARAHALAARFGFLDHLDRPVHELSGGTEQKLNLSLALFHDPELVLLDEPYAGFDRATYAEFLAWCREARASGRTVVVVTHVTFDDELYDEVVELRDGRIQTESSRSSPVALGSRPIPASSPPSETDAGLQAATGASAPQSALLTATHEPGRRVSEHHDAQFSSGDVDLSSAQIDERDSARFAQSPADDRELDDAAPPIFAGTIGAAAATLSDPILSATPSGALGRVGIAAGLLLRDLFRRRLTLLLLFLVPALFDLVVLATTASRPTRVMIGSLAEEGAADPSSSLGANPLFAGLLDDGLRALDQRALSLVFLGGAAVCFLSCFLAFHLVHRRTHADARLVAAGFGAHEVLAAKVVVLLSLVLLLAVYELAIVSPYLAPLHVERVALGFALGGLTYGCFGLLVGALVKHELEGIFAIVLLTNIDVGWLQNPIYYAASESRALIQALPGWSATQIAVTGAFTHALPTRLIVTGLAYAAGVLAVALAAFWWRIRPAGAPTTRQAENRKYYLGVLLVSYVLWIVAFQVVGRYANTLPTHDPTSAWDRAIPLIPAMVWPYELCYVLPLIPLVVIRNWHRFNIAVLALLLANLTAFVVYLAYPIAFPRPELGNSLAEQILAMEYAADFSPGANKLPSMHVAMSWIMCVAMIGESRWYRRIVNATVVLMAVAITISTVCVKQHILIDAVAGVVWGFAAWFGAVHLYRRITEPGAEPREALAQVFQPRRWWRKPS